MFRNPKALSINIHKEQQLDLLESFSPPSSWHVIRVNLQTSCPEFEMHTASDYSDGNVPLFTSEQDSLEECAVEDK